MSKENSSDVVSLQKNNEEDESNKKRITINVPSQMSIASESQAVAIISPSPFVNILPSQPRMQFVTTPILGKVNVIATSDLNSLPSSSKVNFLSPKPSSSKTANLTRLPTLIPVDKRKFSQNNTQTRNLKINQDKVS